MSTPQAQPSFDVIEAALRLTTETLAREIDTPTAEPPQWNDIEWGVARAVCAMQGIGALLASRSRWRGPPSWAVFLRDQQSQGLAHFQRAGRVLVALDAAMREAGIPCVALKGSALRAMNVHAPGVRPMGDIDLLVAQHHVGGCAAALSSIGYEAAYSMRRHDVFIPVDRAQAHAFAEHVENPLRIEVHTRIAEPLPRSEVSITAQLWPADARPGINPYASRVALMRHLLLHTAGNMRAHCMRFIQAYDIAQVARRLEPAEWLELLGAQPPADSWWIYPPLSLAARYLPGCVAPEVLAAFHASCPRWLRSRAERYDLCEVSWSNLRIGALPGCEWSRSPLEFMRYAKHRALPGRAALNELHSTMRAQPAYARVRWYGASHGERILRWVFSRPPRVQTITSVRAALEELM